MRYDNDFIAHFFCPRDSRRYHSMVISLNGNGIKYSSKASLALQSSGFQACPNPMAQMTKTQRPSHAGISFHRDTLTSWNEIGADKGKHHG